MFYNLFEVNLKERENREQNKKLKQQQKVNRKIEI